MNDIAKQRSNAHLWALLNEKGAATPVKTIKSASFGISLDMIRLYGAEVVLPDGGTGCFILREVSQSPDSYIAGLPDENTRRQDFYKNRMSGILAEAHVSQISRRGLFVGRRLRLELQSSNRSSALLNDRRWFSVGRSVACESLFDFDISDMEVIRQLDLGEMEYAEPGRLQMIATAIGHGRRM